MKCALAPNTGVGAGNSTSKRSLLLKVKLVLTLAAAYCLLASTVNGAALSRRKEEARMKRLYSAYDAIVHSDSQLPVFLQYHRQKSPAPNTRTSTGASSGTNNKSKSKRKIANQQPADNTLPQNYYSENLREPREPLLKIQAGLKKNPIGDDSDINDDDDETVAPSKAGGGSERVKPVFVDGVEAATETRSETETETGIHKLVGDVAVRTISNDLNDNGTKTEQALDNDEKTSHANVVNAANAAKTVMVPEAAREVSETAPGRRRSLIVVNGQEYEQADGYLRKVDTIVPANRHYHTRDLEDDNLIVRFIHGNPSANVDDDGDAIPCDSPHLFSSPTFRIAVNRTTIIYALAFTCICWLTLIVSYKMFARRRNTTPTAFFHHIIRGIFISPFGEHSSLSTSMPTTMYSRSSSKESLPLHMNEKSSAEENAVSVSSVRTGQAPGDLRRTSASQYHLQQQLEAARNAYQSQM